MDRKMEIISNLSEICNNTVEILHLYCENQYQLCGAYILGAHINKPISQ